MLEEQLNPSVVNGSMSGTISPGAGLAVGAAQSAVGLVSQIIQNIWNKKMWNEQNEYNSPVQQKQRLLDAGLNPALMYGNGASTGNASSAPKMELNPGSILDGLQLASLASQIRTNNVHNTLYSAQARKTMAEANYLESSMEDRLAGVKLTNEGRDIANIYKSLQADNQRFVNDKQAEVFAQNMSNLQQTILLKIAQTANTSARTEQIDRFLNEQFPEMVRLVSASADFAEARAQMQQFLAKNQGLSYFSDLIEGYLGTIFQGVGTFSKVPGLFGGSSTPVKNNYIDIDTGELLNP